MLPRAYPQWTAGRSQVATWPRDGCWERVTTALREQGRRTAGRAPTPSAGVLDRQRVTTSEAGGERGFDGGKKVVGRQRHGLVDTLGRRLAVLVRPAAVPDVDAA
jgi:putative transposase